MIRRRLSKEDEVIINAVVSKYKKAEGLVRSMFKNGVKVEHLLMGINPFQGVKAHNYMEFVGNYLIENGKTTRADLCDALEKRYEWSRATANSHTHIILNTLMALGVLQENEGTFVLEGK